MKLHVGCGKKYLDGYKHLDVVDYAHVDFVCDARNLHFIEDSSVDEIYASHVLEHFERNQVLSTLREWNRVLREGGEIRIAVPDFESVVVDYGNMKDLTRFQGLLYGGQTHLYNFHHSSFDFKSLRDALEVAGFGHVARYNWQDFLPEGFDDYSRAYLPHMDFENGRLMSLNLVAIKISTSSTVLT